MSWEIAIVVLTLSTFVITLVKTTFEIWYRWKRIQLEKKQLKAIGGV